MISGAGRLFEVFQRIVLEPGDVEVGRVSPSEVVVRDGVEHFGLGSLITRTSRGERLDEVVEVGAAYRSLFGGEGRENRTPSMP
jgi:hypothetical protein